MYLQYSRNQVAFHAENPCYEEVKEYTLLSSFHQSVSLAPSSFYVVPLRPAPCISSLAFPLVSAQYRLFLRLDVESLEKKRDKERERGNSGGARSFALVMHLVKPAQFGLSSCSGRVVGASRHRRVVGPVFDRLSAFS